MLGLVGAAAAIGNFAGNATGARLTLGRPAVIVVRCTAAVVIVAAIVAATDHVLTAALAALVAACASALAKVSLDASLQQDLPEESIASGFGRSETVLQLSWVFGGAMGVLLPTELWLGFTVVTVMLDPGFRTDSAHLPWEHAPAGTRRAADQNTSPQRQAPGGPFAPVDTQPEMGIDEPASSDEEDDRS